MDIIHLKYGLFLKKRFLPLFIAQFLGAFNDNLLRNGLVVMIAYAAERNIPLPIDQPAILITICSALLVMPFIIFSSVAGQVADKFEKHKLIIYTKIAEIIIMGIAFYGFATHNIYLLMFMLFVSGTHSTFFGPIKLSILPEHLKPGELLAGNGFIAAGSYVGILGGLICGALLVPLPGNIIGFAAIGVAVAGLMAAVFIPPSVAAAPDSEVHFRLISGTREIIHFARRSRTVFHSILGISWFLLVGGVFMSQLANYAKGIIQADNVVYTAFLTFFSVGIALGATLADQLLKGEISARYSPYALISVSIFTLLMVIFTPHPTHEGLLTLSEYFAHPQHWLVVGCMLMVAISGGIYMVPLYAMLQTYTESHYRSRVIAASNMFDSLFMVVSALICAVLLSLGVSIKDLFVLLAIANLGMYFYARKAVAHHAAMSA